MKSKTLKEIAEETEQAIFDSNDDSPLEEKIMQACLDFCKSIVPGEKEVSLHGIFCLTCETEGDRCQCVGHNSCRSQILASIEEAEKELNQ